MILDFSKCKTPEDVEAVFARARPQLDAIRKGLNELLCPEPAGEEGHDG